VTRAKTFGQAFAMGWQRSRKIPREADAPDADVEGEKVFE
jgi:hypothetical protein